MSVPLTTMLRQQIETGRAQRQKEYYVQIGPLPEIAAFSLQAVFNERDSPVEARLVEAADHPDR